MGSVVRIATGYGLDGPGIESRWKQDFSHLSRPALGPKQPPVVQNGLGVTLNPHHFLVPWSRKSRAKPLLPLWDTRPVQSLSACTRVHFTLPLQSKYKKLRSQCRTNNVVLLKITNRNVLINKHIFLICIKFCFTFSPTSLITSSTLHLLIWSALHMLLFFFCGAATQRGS
jgi:hypothetical protein